MGLLSCLLSCFKRFGSKCDLACGHEKVVKSRPFSGTYLHFFFFVPKICEMAVSCPSCNEKEGEAWLYIGSDTATSSFSSSFRTATLCSHFGLSPVAAWDYGNE